MKSSSSSFEISNLVLIIRAYCLAFNNLIEGDIYLLATRRLFILTTLFDYDYLESLLFNSLIGNKLNSPNGLADSSQESFVT